MANKFLIKRPIITEKATAISALGKYIFLVDKKATAPEVKKAVEEIYKVNVIGINVINTRPKPRGGFRFPGEKAGYRKIIVTLKEGQKLDILPT
ncbi:MAG: 50S ribosomal protein L23 [Candidatus Harrisonbacteria bacterium]|nr:50S ribosomal protein L23 [Candidatus Harrisonbacteria bacterium]